MSKEEIKGSFTLFGDFRDLFFRLRRQLWIAIQFTPEYDLARGLGMLMLALARLLNLCSISQC